MNPCKARSPLHPPFSRAAKAPPTPPTHPHNTGTKFGLPGALFSYRHENRPRAGAVVMKLHLGMLLA